MLSAWLPGFLMAQSAHPTLNSQCSPLSQTMVWESLPPPVMLGPRETLPTATPRSLNLAMTSAMSYLIHLPWLGSGV